MHDDATAAVGAGAVATAVSWCGRRRNRRVVVRAHNLFRRLRPIVPAAYRRRGNVALRRDLVAQPPPRG